MVAGLECGGMDIRTDEIRSVAFPTLTNDQMAFLKRYGEGRKMQAGQLLFGEGDRSYFGGEARTIAVHGARHGQSVSLR